LIPALIAAFAGDRDADGVAPEGSHA